MADLLVTSNAAKTLTFLELDWLKLSNPQPSLAPPVGRDFDERLRQSI